MKNDSDIVRENNLNRILQNNSPRY